MTEKQKRFVDYFVETGNATEAARRAGYKKPHVQGSQTLENVSVKKAVRDRMAQLESDRIASAEEVLSYLTAAMRGEIDEEVVVVEGSGQGTSEARVTRKQLSAKDRNKAAELLAKRYGLLLDKKELTGAGGTPLQVRWMNSPDEKVAP